MTLSPGMRLGPYEIAGSLGAGGMGEVYRATDTNLGRQVAIKVLPEAFAHDPDRLTRFEREAKTLAALNHPNIAQIHGLEKSNDTTAFVMELVEGPTLADRIAQGAIPIDEALPIAKQIAEALEAAHEKGIIHRDLKPANIKVRADGTVKVLDFGLAKAMEPMGMQVANMSQAPTITTPAMMTGAGVILGTAAYMSPEQARGKPVDKRTDIWAFGCVLYEMLTGKRAVDGDAVPDTLAAVLRGEPDLDALPRDLPIAVRTLTRRCLQKDHARRIANISTARFLLDEDAFVADTTGPSAPGSGLRSRRLLVSSAAAVIAAASLGLIVAWNVPAPPGRPAALHLTADIGVDGSLLAANQDAAMLLSPDGTRLVFVVRKEPGPGSQLYIRRLDQLGATPLPNTDGARRPFFSPDGEWIGFFADGKLKKLLVSSGAVVALCDAVNDRGGSWGDDGDIIFSDSTAPAGAPARGTLFRVSSSGGTPEPVTALSGDEVTHRWPQILPGSAAVLYTSHSRTTGFEDATIVVQPLPGGAPKVLVRRAFHARYLKSGHLVYVHEATLFAVPFDLARLEVVGNAVPVIEQLAAETAQGAAGGAQFSVSDSGAITYLSSNPVGDGTPIEWLGRDGTTGVLRATPANWGNPRFAPDGRHLAVDVYDGRQRDVWIYEEARDTLTRMTSDPGDDRNPVWTPDGSRITFRSTQADKATGNLYWQRADGSGDVQRLTESTNIQNPGSWHPSGRFLAFHETTPTGNDILILPMDGDDASGWRPGKPTSFLATPFLDGWPAFSPDGLWLAYDSNESGRTEVYVRPFPGPGPQWQVSPGGGRHPMWSKSRKEIVYEDEANGRLMAVPYIVEGTTFRPGRPQPWAGQRFVDRIESQSVYVDLHPDGERVALRLAPEAGEEARRDSVTLMFNFFEELRRIAPPVR